MMKTGFVGVLLFVLTLASQAGQTKKHSVTLKWNAPVVRAGQMLVGYNIYRSDREDGHYTIVGNKVSGVTFTDMNVTSGQAYYYRITSVDDKGRESTAATAKATVP